MVEALKSDLKFLQFSNFSFFDEVYFFFPLVVNLSTKKRFRECHEILATELNLVRLRETPEQDKRIQMAIVAERI